MGNVNSLVHDLNSDFCVHIYLFIETLTPNELNNKLNHLKHYVLVLKYLLKWFFQNISYLEFHYF